MSTLDFVSIDGKMNRFAGCNLTQSLLDSYAPREGLQYEAKVSVVQVEDVLLENQRGPVRLPILRKRLGPNDYYSDGAAKFILTKIN